MFDHQDHFSLMVFLHEGGSRVADVISEASPFAFGLGDVAEITFVTAIPLPQSTHPIQQRHEFLTVTEDLFRLVKCILFDFNSDFSHDLFSIAPVMVDVF
jgi:hypothetical protein